MADALEDGITCFLIMPELVGEGTCVLVAALTSCYCCGGVALAVFDMGIDLVPGCCYYCE